MTSVPNFCNENKANSHYEVNGHISKADLTNQINTKIQNGKLGKYKCKSNKEMSEVATSVAAISHTHCSCAMHLAQIWKCKKYTFYKIQKYKKCAAAITHTPCSCTMHFAHISEYDKYAFYKIQKYFRILEILFLRNTDLLLINRRNTKSGSQPSPMHLSFVQCILHRF